MRTAIAALIICGMAGLGLLVAGVYVLAGPGWSLLAGGASMLVCTAFIRAGIRVGVKGG